MSIKYGSHQLFKDIVGYSKVYLGQCNSPVNLVKGGFRFEGYSLRNVSPSLLAVHLTAL